MNDFYIDQLPSNCDYLSPPRFFEQECFEANLQIIDNRWTAQEIETIVSSTIPYGYSDFFKVTDIESNVDGHENWICGFSVFFMKHVFHEEQLYRETWENHQKLIDGVKALIDHPDRSQETVLRFYVSPEAWDAIAAQGLLNSEHTQFYKMLHPSEDSQVGTMWRLLVLDDSDYEYAIETDVAPDEDWIFPRITDSGHSDFLKRLSKFAIAGEVQALPYRTEIGVGLRTPIVDYTNLTRFDHLTAGGIVTMPKTIPPLVPLFCKYLETDSTLTLFHYENNTWTQMLQQEHLYWGWRGLGPDQNFWRFLKRTIPARHAVYEPFAEEFRVYPPDHYFWRMVRQFEKSGHQFIIDHTEQPLLELLNL